MKKILSVFLLVVMVASMMIAASAADTKVFKTYKEAKDGDLLWIVDFSSTGGTYKPVGDDNFNKTSDAIVSENGRAVTVKSKAGAADKTHGYWGGAITDLVVDKNSKVTVTWKVRANGENGKNNSTSLSAWLYDDTDGGVPVKETLAGIYGNWNSKYPAGTADKDIINREVLTHPSKVGDYGNVSANALEDKDGFMQVKLEYDAAAGEFRGYIFTKDNKWTMTPLTWKMSNLNDKDDCLGVVLYTYYNICDATHKDVKIFRGIGLTDAQLAAEAPKAPAETTAAVTQAQPAPSAPAAPTADVSVILSMVAAIAASGAVVLKKKH